MRSQETLKRSPGDELVPGEGKRANVAADSDAPVAALPTAAALSDTAAMPPPPATEPPGSTRRGIVVLGAGGDELIHAGSSSGSDSTASMQDELPSPWLTSVGYPGGILPSPALLPSGAMSSMVMGMSPALLPSAASGINISLDELPESARSSEQHFFPLDFSAPRPFGSPAGAPSSPAEGGIMMLSDLQEEQASRATLDSALRDYGVSLVAGGTPNRCGARTPGSEGRASSSLLGAQPSLLSQLSRKSSNDAAARARSRLGKESSRGKEASRCASRDAASGTSEEQARVPRWRSGLDDAGAEAEDSVFTLSNGIRAPSPAPQASSAAPAEPSEEVVRLAVVTEMAGAHLTQYTVAQQAGITQPALCTWLSGKPHKGSGKNAKQLFVSRLAAWLRSRGREELLLGGVDLPPLQLGGRGSPMGPAPAAAAPAVAAAVPARRARPAAGGGKRGGKGVGGKGAADEGGEGSEEALEGRLKPGGRMRLTEQHLYVAYVWYLNERDHHGRGGEGQEEHFCFKCKDGGDVMLCDFADGGCSKSYHMRCCNLDAVPEGLWECPRHRCVQCGQGQAKPCCDKEGGNSSAKGKRASSMAHLWPCRTCPQTFCAKCLPEQVLHVGPEIICLACQTLLSSDLSLLQRDLLSCDPDQFAHSAGHR